MITKTIYNDYIFGWLNCFDYQTARMKTKLGQIAFYIVFFYQRANEVNIFFFFMIFLFLFFLGKTFGIPEYAVVIRITLLFLIRYI